MTEPDTQKVAIDFARRYAGDQDYVVHDRTIEHTEAGMTLRKR